MNNFKNQTNFVCPPGFKKICICIPEDMNNIQANSEVGATELSSKEYSVHIFMRQPSSASGNAINGYAHSICEADAKRRVDSWNDGPDGKIFEFDHVEVLRLDNMDTDTEHDPWTGVRHWQLHADATYNLYYTRL